MPHATKSSRTLAWADGNPLSEYQKEYYRKQLLREQARRAQLRDAGKAKEYAVGETLLDFASLHDPFLGGTVTSNRLDYVPKQSSTKTSKVPEHPPMPARKFIAETVYSNTFTKKPFSTAPFDAKSNVNVARNAYDPQGNPWFGKSLNSVDFPNWGHPHQAPLVNKSRPLGPCLPFTATTTAKADYKAPGTGAQRHQKAAKELAPSAPLANATMYREDLEWSGGASRAAPCTVGYLAEAEPSLETACCQAAETHSQQIVDSLTDRDQQGEAKAEGKAKGHKAHIKPELMGAAGSNNAPCTVLTGKRMYAENLQQIAGPPYAAGGSLKPETNYQAFCAAAVH